MDPKSAELYAEEQRTQLIETHKAIIALNTLVQQQIDQYKEPPTSLQVTGEVSVNTEKSVEVNNLVDVCEKLESLERTVTDAIKKNSFKPLEEVSIKNIQEAKTETVKVSNLKELANHFQTLQKAIQDNVPIVQVTKQVVEFPTAAGKPVSVRLSDGKSFYNALTAIAGNTTPQQRLDTALTDSTTAVPVKSVSHGKQPDGDYVPERADGQFFNTQGNLGSTRLNGSLNDSATTITVDSTSTLASSGQVKIDSEYITYTGKTSTTLTGCTRGALGSTATTHSDNSSIGETYVSNWYDTDGFGTLEFFFTSDVPSANKGIVIDFTDNTNTADPTIQSQENYEYKESDVRIGFRDLHTRPKLDGFRIKYTNGDEAQTNIYISATGRRFPEVGTENSGNAIVTASFEREIALGNVSNYGQNTKFGRNTDVGTANAADVWGGGRAGLGVYNYTGFNATANENLQTLSSSTSDVGTLVSSGIITSTSNNKVIDTGATFISDGVAVGDVVLNDSRGTHGYVTSVDSETQITVLRMQDSEIGEYDNITGNSYRVATAGSTGAAVVVWKRILDSNYRRQTNVFVILNGTTPVSTTINAYRCSRGRVVLAGSSGNNIGEITCRQATTTANIFCVMPIGSNTTLIACDTVPAGSVYLIETVSAAMSISGGAAASAVVSLRSREGGGVFNTERIYDLTSGGGTYEDREIGGILFQSGTDFKLRVDSVSNNGTRVSGRIEYLEIDEV